MQVKKLTVPSGILAAFSDIGIIKKYKSETRCLFSEKQVMRPDFKKISKQMAALAGLDELLQGMFAQTEQLGKSAAGLCTRRLRKQAAVQLKGIPVDELKNSRAGIRTLVLEQAGYQTLFDLWQADDVQLSALNGVGEKQIASIRMITDEFLGQLSGRERIRLPSDPADADAKDRELVSALARYRLAEQVCRDARGLCDTMHAFAAEIKEKVRIHNRVHWFFSGKEKKEETLDACEALERYSSGQDFARAQRFYALYLDAVSIDEAGAFSDFGKNSAAYYAMLDRLIGSRASGEIIYGSIPAQLAAEVSAEETFLENFRGDLRGYQLFGVQYVLHQKKVLLGDEMGLGKTIQAIAVMVHLHSLDPGCRFLIVCPASVMVNWCREIRKFSGIDVQMLHGSFLEEGFAKWYNNGGAAVVNYESMRHITDRIDNHLKMALMVIDEAHYIKNPEAQRTRYIHRLEDESERILMMTGTPLENRVNEMCELIGFVRPDLVPKIRAYAGLRKVAAFREMLSPVYLRRQADQVLEELPELIENEEWCGMSLSDREAYTAAVIGGNFMAMRRVSFLQEDLSESAKARRLTELCSMALEEGRKVVVFSYFRETLRYVRMLLNEICIGEISGSTDPEQRQGLIDRFSEAPGGSVLLSQIQAGGTGVNIQAASVVIFCEPQIKPSLERQAVSRVYRMGQIRKVLVYHLLCEHTVDESVRKILEGKEKEFALYADESVMADAEAGLADKEWIRNVVEEERKRYLPAVIRQETEFRRSR